MTGLEAIQMAATVSQMADPYVKSMEGTDLNGDEKHAAVKGMVRLLVFGASTLSPDVGNLLKGVSVTQMDAMIDVAIAGLVELYNVAGIFADKIKKAIGHHTAAAAAPAGA